MKIKKNFLLVRWGVFLLILLAAVACSPGAAQPPVEVEATEEAPALAETAQPESGAGETVAETEAAPEEAGTGGEEVPVAENGVAEDIPVPEAAYQLQVARQGTNISFQVDGTIDEIVGFYTEQLEALGWNKATNPDSAVGSIATLFRKNEAGDQLSINMQKNELGGFVRVTIVLQRAP
jgi:hypothetical protein